MEQDRKALLFVWSEANAGKEKSMKKIDELVGIIQGIDSDNTVSVIETENLKT